MKFQALLPALLLTLFVTFTSCKEEKKTETAPSQTEAPSDTTTGDLTAEVRYQCPMDCEDGKTYEAEGKCPVCKMDLKPVSK